MNNCWWRVHCHPEFITFLLALEVTPTHLKRYFIMIMGTFVRKGKRGR